MITVPATSLRSATFAQLVEVTGRLSQFCDRLDHNEGVDRCELLDVGALLRQSAVPALRASSLDVRDTYAARLEGIEARNVLHWSGATSWPEMVRNSKSWRDVQIAQCRHDEAYHPDVIGLSRADQLKHYTLHLGKLSWKMQDGCSKEDAWREFAGSRLIDLLIFGVKLATVTNFFLSEEVAGEFG